MVDALRLVLNEPVDPKSKKGARKIRRIAERLVDEAMDGNIQAIKEVWDRMEGKPAQAINVGGQAENPLLTEAQVTIEFINATPKSK